MSKEKKLCSVYGWRWEPEWLIDESRENLAGVVDELHVIDDRSRTGPWRHEGEYRRQQRDILKSMGADWVLLTSGDERIEDGAAEKIREIINNGPQNQCYTLRVCEMWTPTQYRVDGKFLDRQRYRLFPLSAMFARLPNRRIHCPPFNRNYRINAKRLDVRFYHLKHIEAQNRIERTAMMRELDKEINKNRDWNHFLEEDIVLEDLPEGRGFSPAYTKPFLWVPESAYE